MYPLCPSFLLSTILGHCPVYDVQSVGGQDCGVFGPTGAVGFGLSSSGMVCGYSWTCNNEDFPFFWTGGGPLMQIAFPGAGPGRAQDVNTQGDVVGEVSAPSEGGQRGFKWRDGNGVFLQPPLGDGMSSALAINSAGVAVGSSIGIGVHAVHWTTENGVSLQPQLPLGPSSSAEDINDIGQVCGWMGQSSTRHAFIWQNGKALDLGIPDGAVATSANAINNLGDACGFALWSDPDTKSLVLRPCAWIDGKFIDLGVLPDNLGGLALDINDAREIVGYCTSASGAPTPFIWRDDVMIKLADLLPSGSLIPEIASATNNIGQIAGYGSLPLPDGNIVAFRITPALPQIPGNTNCDAAVDVDDLINVILNWNPQGPVGGDPSDVNRDNRIDVLDLVDVIIHWGAR